MQKYLFIPIGGALGSLARFWVGSTAARRLGTRFPYGTLAVNLTACVILGLSLALLNRHSHANPALRFLIPVGFIGAYSAFSTFEWETFANLQTGAFLIAALYVVVSIVMGPAGVWRDVVLANAVS
jgi:CrcB protein